METTWTLSAICEHYIRRRIFNADSENLYWTSARRLEQYIKERGLTLQQVDEELLLDWRSLLLQQVSRVTINTYLQHLRALFAHAERYGLLASNPMRSVTRVPVLQKGPKTLDPGAFDTAIEYLRSPDRRMEPAWFWIVVLYTLRLIGMRARQAIELRWEDLDFEKRLIRLRAEGSKTRREWQIPMMEELKDHLEDLRARTRTVTTLRKEMQVLNVTLFHSRYKGEEMTREQLSGALKRLSAHIGVKISSHRIRHTVGTQMGNVSAPNIIAIKNLLGHTDVRTTAIYIAIEVETMRAELCRAYHDAEGK